MLLSFPIGGISDFLGSCDFSLKPKLCFLQQIYSQNKHCRSQTFKRVQEFKGSVCGKFEELLFSAFPCWRPLFRNSTPPLVSHLIPCSALMCLTCAQLSPSVNFTSLLLFMWPVNFVLYFFRSHLLFTSASFPRFFNQDFQFDPPVCWPTTNCKPALTPVHTETHMQPSSCIKTCQQVLQTRLT